MLSKSRFLKSRYIASLHLLTAVVTVSDVLVISYVYNTYLHISVKRQTS